MNCSAVQLHSAISNGESQPGAAAGAISCLTDAIKGLEDVLQFTLGNTRTVVANRKLGRFQLPVETDFDGGPFPGIADSIADDVFNGAAQQFDGAIYTALIELHNSYFFVERLGFEIGVVNDLLHQ